MPTADAHRMQPQASGWHPSRPDHMDSWEWAEGVDGHRGILPIT